MNSDQTIKPMKKLTAFCNSIQLNVVIERISNGGREGWMHGGTGSIDAIDAGQLPRPFNYATEEVQESGW